MLLTLAALASNPNSFAITFVFVFAYFSFLLIILEGQQKLFLIFNSLFLYVRVTNTVLILLDTSKSVDENV